jgi:hypothetical protein
MDFQQRIAEATAYRDQTKGAYDQAKEQTGQAQSAYDTAFTTAPTYQTVYEQNKQSLTNTQEIADMNNSWKQAKESTDTIKGMIDKLPGSITQQFGGTGLTQAQRDMAKSKQLSDLSKQFTQYNADYQMKFTDYNQTVDKAFNSALDVANKSYDSYWDGVRMKYTDWQTSIKNQDEWQKMYYTSTSQLQKTQGDYDNYRFQQQQMNQQREFETWMTNFKINQSNTAGNGARAGQAFSEDAARKKADADTRFRNDTAAFQSGKLSSTEYLKRMDAGLYRS